jgi:hypothetical protein
MTLTGDRMKLHPLVYPLSMIALALAAAVAIVGFAPRPAAAAGAPQTVSVQVPLGQAAECEQHGGCAFITREQFAAALRNAFVAGGRAARVQCGKDL